MPSISTSSACRRIPVWRPTRSRPKNATRSAQTIVATYVVGPNHTHTGQKVVVNYDFLREGGAWKIDNVRSTAFDKKPWTLRDNLEMHLKSR